MSNLLDIVWTSIIHQKGSHLASAASMSAGVAENLTDPAPISAMESVISIAGDCAVIIAPVFTLYLFYKAWNENRLTKLDIQLKELMIAKEGRRESD